MVFGRRAAAAERVLIDGNVGVVVAPCGRLLLAFILTFSDGKSARMTSSPARRDATNSPSPCSTTSSPTNLALRTHSGYRSALDLTVTGGEVGMAARSLSVAAAWQRADPSQEVRYGGASHRLCTLFY